MRVVWLKEFGGPDVLEPGDAPDPVAAPGEVVVDVGWSGVTFVETQFRATGKGPFRAEPPFVPGNGVGGTVAAVGDGVDPGLLGTRVVTSTGGSGGYAQRVAVPAGNLFAVPDGVALDTAVALLADGRTATMLVEAADVRPGDRVLVEAAAGGVGTLLVQLAAAAGAHVVAAAGGEAKLALARELGAHDTVDYRAPGWTAALAPVDVVLDGVGGDIGVDAFHLLRSGGRMVSFGLASGAWAGVTEDEAEARNVSLRSLRPTPERIRAATGSALAEAEAGRLRPVIGARFPLERAADAHALIESRGSTGKTLLEI